METAEATTWPLLRERYAGAGDLGAGGIGDDAADGGGGTDGGEQRSKESGGECAWQSVQDRARRGGK